MSGEKAPSDAGAAAKYTDSEAVAVLNATFPAGLRLMNAKCLSASNADASVVMQYDLDHRFLNAVGFVCGGYVANALDQTASYSMAFITGDAAPTLEIKVSFISPASPGQLVVTGKVVRAGRSFGFVEAVARNAQGALIATASATVQRVPMAKAAMPA